MIIAVIGLGLIGGSLCKAIKAKTSHTCLGLDTDPGTIHRAKEEHAIDGSITEQELGQADLTIVALHPRQTIDFILRNTRHFQKGSVVMDTCGVKTAVVEAVSAQLAGQGVTFVGAHPMAGREFSGYAYAETALFDGASFILTPTEDTPRDIVHVLREFALSLGFGKCVSATPQQHDETIAFTSQLAHIVSNAYVKSPSLLKECGFSAGSFLDLTRVAKLNEDMWTDLFLLNRPPLLAELDTLLENLTEYRDALREGQADRMHQLLRDGRVLKEKSLITR